MKRLFLALTLLALSTLPACASLDTARQVVSVATGSTPIGNFTVLDDKALSAALTAYNIPAFAYRSADQKKLIPAPLKATIKPMLQYAGSLLKAAKAAYAIGDLTTFNARYKALIALKGQVMDLLPK